MEEPSLPWLGSFCTRIRLTRNEMCQQRWKPSTTNCPCMSAHPQDSSLRLKARWSWHSSNKDRIASLAKWFMEGCFSQGKFARWALCVPIGDGVNLPIHSTPRTQFFCWLQWKMWLVTGFLSIELEYWAFLTFRARQISSDSLKNPVFLSSCKLATHKLQNSQLVFIAKMAICKYLQRMGVKATKLFTNSWLKISNIQSLKSKLHG